MHGNELKTHDNSVLSHDVVTPVVKVDGSPPHGSCCPQVEEEGERLEGGNVAVAKTFIHDTD